MGTKIILSFAAALAFAGTSASATDDFTRQDLINGYSWVHGPASVSLERVASFELPAGALFLDAKSSDRFLKEIGNRGGPGILGTLYRPEWRDGFAVFVFSPVERLNLHRVLAGIGKKSLRAPASLPGSSAMVYDSTRHTLEQSSERFENGGGPIANHSIQIEGPSGVMNMVLVGAPELMPRIVSDFRDLLPGLSFNTEPAPPSFGGLLFRLACWTLVVAAAVLVYTRVAFGLVKTPVLALLAGYLFFRTLFGKRKKAESSSDFSMDQTA